MIDKVKNSNYLLRLVLALAIVFLLLSYIVKQLYFREDISRTPTYEYVGKETCISCHESAYNDWVGSDHDKAMNIANDSTVLGNFNNAIYNRNNQEHRCYKKDGKFWVYTDGENGEMKDFEVKYVFGYDPLQNYLVEFPGGRLQTLALTWNNVDRYWYYMSDSTYKGQNIDHGNWYHWTNQSQNWNSMCAYCHSTNLIKGYNPETDQYNTSWSEINVSCEACHGPSSYHLEWAEMPDYEKAKIENFGLTKKTSDINNFQYVDNCMRCHALGSYLKDYDHRDQSIYDHILPNLPIEPNYYIDGQIKGEDYVYGSFTQSKMYMNDVQCNDCHNVHSGQLILEDNELCTQCHLADIYDSKTHHFHKDYGEDGKAVISEAGVKFEVGSGTLCVQCHMHAQYYMGIDYRSDHSMRVPRPDLSEKLGTPNACNQCHADKNNQWAESQIQDWFGKSRKFHFGEAIFAASKHENGSDSKLKEIISDEVYPPSIRMTALSYLDLNNENNYNLVLSYLQNIEPLFRLTALRTIQSNIQLEIDKILPLLNDEVKAVRMEAANKLSFLTLDQIPEIYQDIFSNSINEYKEHLMYNSNFPLGKYNLANFYYFRKEYELSEKYYLAALEQDPQLDFILMNISSLYGSMNLPQEAEKYLELYIKKHPDDPSGNYNYGLILSENKKYEQSLKHLLKASKSMPHNSRVDINISELYKYFGDIENQEKHLKIAIDKNIDQIENHIYLLNFYISNNQSSNFQSKAKNIIELFPDSQEAQTLKTRIQL